jgi:hypothetical protein
MFKRITVLIGTVLAVLMAVGIGSAIVNPSTTDSAGASAATLSTSPRVTVEASGDTVVYEAGDAGIVTVTSDGSALAITSIDPADGWVAEVEVAAGRQVEASFRDGTRRIKFDAELEDGQVNARVSESSNESERDDSRDPGDDDGSQEDDSRGGDSLGGDDNSTPTTNPSGSTSTTTTTSPSTDTGSTATYRADNAGSVTITSNGSSLTIVSVSPTAGWTYEIEVASGREVEVDFRNGSRRIQFDAELEDGRVDIRVRESIDDNGGSTTTTTTMPTTTTTVPPTTSTTTPPTGDTTVTYDAGEGGTVTIASNGSTLTIVSVNPAAGWAPEVEIVTGREVEVDFRNDSRRIQFDAELEDGQVRIRVRESVD